MPVPSCTIEVCFFEDPLKFVYLCTSHSPTWRVGPEGVICPPTRSRVIRFDLHSIPAGAELIGLRLATHPNELQTTNDPYFNNTSIQITHQATSTEPYIEIDDNTPSSPRAFWAIGIDFGGVPHWDDPRIYNPPDD